MKIFLFFIFFLIFANSKSPKHKCIHNKIKAIRSKITVHKIQISELIQPLRILSDFSNFRVQAKEKEIFQFKILPLIENTIKKYFFINHHTQIFKFKKIKCVDAKIPLVHRILGIKNMDLVLYFSSSYEPKSEAIAWATSCYQDSQTNRPIAGQINLNFFFLKNNSYSHIANTITHELMHVLGFDSSLYDQFINREGKLIPSWEIYSVKKEQKFLIIPELLNYVRDFFDCKDLNGVPLEIGAGAGSDDSHWLEEQFLDEIMAPYDNPVNSIVSNLTILFFNATGWYHMKPSNNKMTWGYKKGCDFFKYNDYKEMKKFDEYCFNLNNYGCSIDYKSISQCYSVTSQNLQALNFPDTDCSYTTNKYNQTLYQLTGNEYKSGSKCFISSLRAKKIKINQILHSGQRCFPAKCKTNENNETFIHIKFKEHDLVCKKSFEWLSSPDKSKYKGVLLCPDIQNFCNLYKTNCPFDCNGNGNCLDDKCVCNDFFGGDDCSTRFGIFE